MREAVLSTNAVRIGGLLGIVSALVLIPAFVAGFPDQPRTAEQVIDYYENGSSFVTANGAVPLLHILFGLAFLSVLMALLRRAAGPSPGVYMTLAGGVVFFALSAAGFAAEIAYPAALTRFGEVMGTEFTAPLLTLSAWLYHYCQIGASAMIFAASVVIGRTGALPKWTAIGAILGVLPLVHTWIPLPGTISTLMWIALIGVVMLVAPIREPTATQPVDNDRSSTPKTLE